MRFIIDFRDDTSEEKIASYFEDNACTVIETLSLLGATYLVEAEVAPKRVAIIEHLLNDEKNTLKLLSLQSELATKQIEVTSETDWWKVAMIKGVNYDHETADIIRMGQGWRVYLLDSGIDETHPEFAGKDVTLLHSKDDDFSDVTGHGTALASLIVGETCGISEASLKVVKIFNGEPTTIGELLTAFQRVAEDFQTDPTRPAIINMSWGITKNAFIESKIASLIGMGFVAVAAAGNTGVAIDNVTPASMPEVLTVGSFGPNLVPSDFSNYTDPSDTSFTPGETNYGVGLDLFAPGENIRVALVGGGFGMTVGTSAAAAIVSAVSIVNLANANPTFDHQFMTMFVLRERYITRDLLTLEGNYESCPNIVPAARMVPYDPAEESPRTNFHVGMSGSGRDFGLRMFETSGYTDAKIVSSEIPGAELRDNWLVGVAPEVEKTAFYKTKFELTNSIGETEEFEFMLIVQNYEAYASGEEAAEDANLALYSCNCGVLAFGGPIGCCTVCNKTINCSECAVVVSPSEWVCP